MGPRAQGPNLGYAGYTLGYVLAARNHDDKAFYLTSKPYEEQFNTTEVLFKAIEVGFRASGPHFKVIVMHFSTTENLIKNTEDHFRKINCNLSKLIFRRVVRCGAFEPMLRVMCGYV